jgi:excisionase family DNA binding protein
MKTSSERAVYSPEEAGEILGLGRNSTYDAIRRGEIPSLRVGKRILIPKIGIERMLADASARPVDEAE